MVNPISPKPLIGSLIVLGGITVLVALLSAGSANPIEVYSSGGVVGIVIVSLLLLLIASSLMQLAARGLVTRMVGHSAGMPAENVMCGGCGLPLVKFIGSHGMPIRCPTCHTVWHNGPACYNEGMPRGRIVAPVYSCPRCRGSMVGERELSEGLL